MDVTLDLSTHGATMAGSPGTLGTRPGSWPPVYAWNNSRVAPKGHSGISEQQEGRSILSGSFVLSLWPVNTPPVALYIDPSVTPKGKGVKVWYTRPGRDPLPATVLPHSRVCIVPDGQDLPMLVALKHVFYHP